MVEAMTELSGPELDQAACEVVGWKPVEIWGWTFDGDPEPYWTFQSEEELHQHLDLIDQTNQRDGLTTRKGRAAKTGEKVYAPVSTDAAASAELCRRFYERTGLWVVVLPWKTGGGMAGR